jgi:Clostripain family
MSNRSSLLLYMTASKRLIPYARATLKRLAAAPRHDGLAIVVELDARGKKKPERYRLEGNKLVPVPASSWSYQPRRAVRDFVDWGLARARGKSALVMWGEGGGWIYPAGLYDAPRHGRIDVELDEAIGGTKRGSVDVLGFDACLMGMVEILYGTRDVCRAFVASETFVPLAGWPYPHILAALGKKPVKTPAAWAERVVPEIANVKGSATLSAFDPRRADAIARAFGGLARALKALPMARHADIARARAETLHVGNPDFVDVLSLLRALERRVKDRAVASAVKTTRREVLRARLAHAAAGADNGQMSGLSIFFPPEKTSLMKDYTDLAFAKKTGWGGVLARLYP